MSEQSNKGDRLLGLSDAVFGIAITFLAVDFVVPLAVDNDAQLASFLASRLSNYIVYFVSFIVIGFMWWEHHRTHQFAPFTDSTQRALGVHALMFVAATPFASSLVGHNPTLPLALFVFFAILAVMSGANLKSWSLGVKTSANVADLSDADVNYLRQQLALTTLAFSVCAVLALVAHATSLPHWTSYFGLLGLVVNVFHHRRMVAKFSTEDTPSRAAQPPRAVASLGEQHIGTTGGRGHLIQRLKRGSDTERLIVFTDGIYAISMTLVAMRLSVPDTPFDSDEALLYQYLHNGQWRPFLAYVVTFLILAGFWRVHCVIYDRVRQTDTVLLCLNLAHLLGIGLLPFAEEMLMMDAVGPVSCGIYVSMLLLSTASLGAILLVASRREPPYWHALDSVETRRLRLCAWGYILCLIPTLFLVIFPQGLESEVWLSTLCMLMLVGPYATIFSGQAPLTWRPVTLGLAAPVLVALVGCFDTMPGYVAWSGIVLCLLCLGRIEQAVSTSRSIKSPMTSDVA
ncbi:MAG: TMEM175 family protein [Myxococcota bacterium]|nr:TMEM175 family protein [Myxococcota bacterium]